MPRAKRTVRKDGITKARSGGPHRGQEQNGDGEYAMKQLTKAVQNPSKAASDENKPRAFVVWKSQGNPDDGFHSHEGEPEKEFDSSWSTKKEANSRARYLFFWENGYRIEPKELYENYVEVESSTKQGMAHFAVCPANSGRWTVGVVPSSAAASTSLRKKKVCTKTKEKPTEMKRTAKKYASRKSLNNGSDRSQAGTNGKSSTGRSHEEDEDDVDDNEEEYVNDEYGFKLFSKLYRNRERRRRMRMNRVLSSFGQV